MALWDENFYTAKVGGDVLIGQLQQRGRLSSGYLLDYAAGLVIGEYRGLRTVEHAGADAGYRADIIRFPDRHFSAATLCNLASADPGALNHRIADIYLAGALAPAKTPTRESEQSFQPSATRLTELVGTYIDVKDIRVLRLRMEDGKLLGGSLRGKGYELNAIDNRRWRYLASPTELTFDGEENAPPERMTCRFPSRTDPGFPLRTDPA